MIELGWNTIVKLERQEYVDFVGRLFRFQEALAEYVFQSETGREINWESKTEGNRSFSAALKDYPELTKKIREEVKLDMGDNLENLRINTTVLHVCFRHFVEKTVKSGDNYGRSTGKSRRIVDNLRHYTIVAHGFQGVSVEKIEEQLEGESLGSFKEGNRAGNKLGCGSRNNKPF